MLTDVCGSGRQIQCNATIRVVRWQRERLNCNTTLQAIETLQRDFSGWQNDAVHSNAQCTNIEIISGDIPFKRFLGQQRLHISTQISGVERKITQEPRTFVKSVRWPTSATWNYELTINCTPTSPVTKISSILMFPRG